jgi:transcriptional regulator with XRE-family HTH domain
MNYKQIGKRIRSEREGLGLTRERFAELLELSTNFVGQIERGEKKMSLETLTNISVCLHVSLDYLIKGTPENTIHTNKLQRLISKCSNEEISLITDMLKSMLPHLKKLK